jgi:serine/threonine protein phosphatase PrpC
MVFSHVEILNPWFPTSQIGQAVINTLIREYYAGSDTSELVNFENAIKKVNEALAQIAQNGDTDWIGKFSSVLVLISGKDAHFAQTGHSHAYLYRGGKINHITEGLEQEEAPHPLKTFSNLTSGTLEEGDKIIVANTSFYEILEPSELKTIMSDLHPTEAALECARILQSRGNQNANAIIFELTTKGELANLAPEQKAETIYIDQPGLSFNATMRNIWRNFFIPSGKFIKNAGQALGRGSKKHLAPAIHHGLKVSKKGLQSALGATAKITKKEAEKLSQRISQKVSPIKEVKDKKQAKTLFYKTKNKIRRFLIGIGLYSTQKSKMYLVALIAVILVLAAAITFSVIKHSQAKSNHALEMKLNQAVSIEGEAAIANSKGQENDALNKYKTVLALVAALQGTKYEKDAKSISERAAVKIDEITKTTHLKPINSVDLGQGQAILTLTSDKLTATYSSGEIKQKKPQDLNLLKLAQSKIAGDKAVSSAFVPEYNLAAYILKDDTIQTFNFETKQTNTEEVKINYPGQISSFSGNLYILDPPSNQIWKILSEDGKYKNNSPYLKDTKANVSDAISMAVDGSIYTLTPSGDVSRFSRGSKLGDFKISLPGDEQLSGWEIISTSASSDNLYLGAIDNNKARIFELKKNGTYIKQFSLDNSEDVKSILVDPDRNIAYIAKDNQLLTYQF